MTTPAQFKLTKREKQFKRMALIAVDALKLYGDPGFYHAILFMCDPPGGGFDKDFDMKHGDKIYNRVMPGKAARKALQKINKIATKENL